MLAAAGSGPGCEEGTFLLPLLSEAVDKHRRAGCAGHSQQGPGCAQLKERPAQPALRLVAYAEGVIHQRSDQV
jgi:hypothetical protein